MAFTSPLDCPPLDQEQLFHNFVLESTSSFGDHAALVDAATGRMVTYRQLDTASSTVAASLAHRSAGGGLKEGDTLAIFAPNVPEYAVATLAALKLGAVVALLNPLLTPADLGQQLVQCKAKYVITVAPLVEILQRARKLKKTHVCETFLLGEGTKDIESFFTLYLSHGEYPPAREVNVRSPALIAFSGGLTGASKGVVLSHANVTAAMQQLAAAENVQNRDVVLSVFPMCHMFGFVCGLFVPLRARATVVCMPRFEFEGFMNALEQSGATRAVVAPPIVTLLAKHPLVDRYDTQKLRFIVTSSAPLSEASASAVVKRIGCAVKQGYGLTELTGLSHIVPDETDIVRHGSVGMVLPHSYVRIVDTETGSNLGVGEVGELWVKGPQVMFSYVGDDMATRNRVDKEGYLHTGDLGYVDEDGFFFIVDRVEEMISTNGTKVSPSHLEALVMTHPDVADVAVIGVPDDTAGSVAKAVVVRTQDSDVTSEQLKTHCEAVNGGKEQIAIFEFVERIPRSSTGKTLRRAFNMRTRDRKNTQQMTI